MLALASTIFTYMQTTNPCELDISCAQESCHPPVICQLNDRPSHEQCSAALTLTSEFVLSRLLWTKTLIPCLITRHC